MIRAVVAAALAAALAGCPGAAVRSQTRQTAELIATARDSGAQRCAPVELAMAEAHNEFAGHALDEGNYHDAREDADIAQANARLAVDRSPKERCAERGAPPPVAPGPGDGDGDGVPDPDDRCPRVAEDRDGWNDDDGCPEDDNDRDGIADRIDSCPDQAEDRDAFEDDDGCPDADNDRDGLADKVDQCPSEGEDRDGHEDDDGCPDADNDRDGIADAGDRCPNESGVPPDGCPKKYTNVVVTETRIELKQTVFFATNQATIKRVSFALLDEVALALKDNPKISVEIQGHTDSQGNDSSNLKLSQRRAEAVRSYLIGRAVTGNRMIAKGYGERAPIADNRTNLGRTQNRRVEFVITAR